MWSQNLLAFVILGVIQLFGFSASRNYPDVLSYKTTINNIKGTSPKLQLLLDYYFNVSIKENCSVNILKIVSNQSRKKCIRE